MLIVVLLKFKLTTDLLSNSY